MAAGTASQRDIHSRAHAYSAMWCALNHTLGLEFFKCVTADLYERQQAAKLAGTKWDFPVEADEFERLRPGGRYGSSTDGEVLANNNDAGTPGVAIVGESAGQGEGVRLSLTADQTLRFMNQSAPTLRITSANSARLCDQDDRANDALGFIVAGRTIVINLCSWWPGFAELW